MTSTLQPHRTGDHPVAPGPTDAADTRSRRRRTIVVILIAIGVVGGVVTSVRRDTRTDTPAHEAAPAAAFVASIGVNTHLHYDDTAYARFDDIVRPRLLELGIRHVRDAVYTYDGASADSFYYRRVRDLGRQGIRFNLLTSIATPHSERTDLSKLAAVVRWTEGAVDAFEGANEPDLAGLDDWVTPTRDLQRELWQTVNESEALRDVAVIGPSPVWAPDELGDLSAWTDYGNWHAYPGGACPSCVDAAGETFDSRVDAYREPTGSAPLMVTETGYHNAVVGEQDHRPASELAAGKYVPRLLFEYFNRGVARTYLYELLDQRDDPGRQDREANFGLLRADGSPKPAFVALRNLIDLLGEQRTTAPPSAASTLAFELRGQVDGVHHTLLRKRDGRFYLALWQARSSYDTDQRAGSGQDVDTRGDTTVRPQHVTVATGDEIAAIKLFVPRRGVTALRTERGTRTFAVAVPDEVVILELTP